MRQSLMLYLLFSNTMLQLKKGSDGVAKTPQYKDAVFRKYFMHKTRVLSLYRP